MRTAVGRMVGPGEIPVGPGQPGGQRKARPGRSVDQDLQRAIPSGTVRAVRNTVAENKPVGGVGKTERDLIAGSLKAYQLTAGRLGFRGQVHTAGRLDQGRRFRIFRLQTGPGNRGSDGFLGGEGLTGGHQQSSKG